MCKAIAGKRDRVLISSKAAFRKEQGANGLDALKSEPSFVAIAKKMHLPEAEVN